MTILLLYVTIYQRHLKTYNGINSIEHITAAITAAARKLPKKSKTNHASGWWNKALTNLRQGCLTARAEWRNAQKDEKLQAEAVYKKIKRDYINAQRDER